MAGGAAAAGLGVAGAAVSGLQFIGEQGVDGIKEALRGVQRGLLVAIRALPRLIGRVLPRFAVSLVSKLIPALIRAAPRILQALIVELPVALAKAIVDALSPGGGPATGSLSAEAQQEAAEFRERREDRGTSTTDDIIRAAGGNPSRPGSRGRSAARAADAGRTSFARAEDRLAMSSTRPRRRPSVPVAANPFEEFSRQFSVQAGDYGRFTSRIGGVH